MTPPAESKRRTIFRLHVRFWVTSRQSVITELCPLYPRKRTNGRHRRMSALCCGFNWSVQHCS